MHMPTNRHTGQITISGQPVGAGNRLLVIAGPCVIESVAQCVEIASALSERCAGLGLSYVFKASFDKANRSSLASARGPGLDGGLAALAEVRQRVGVPVTTDMHEPMQADAVGRVVDLVQVPAFLCRQTDLLAAAAATGKPVNVKKGQFMSPHEMTHPIAKLTASNAAGVMLTERGTFFGYNRLVNDFIGFADMADLGCPVCFDVTHSTQQPGGQGARSGGRPERAPLLAKLAVVAGADALFIETHPDPPAAPSDAASMMKLGHTLELLTEVARLRTLMHQA
jgi:2-dehydro-3-deoxyphosphooctonate aldolase (KDO 8-P synthase)